MVKFIKPTIKETRYSKSFLFRYTSKRCVNKRRRNPSYRVLDGDHIRVPPFIENEAWISPHISAAFEKRLGEAIVHDDKNILVLNKPTGLAVHGGSGIRSGLIESLRLLFPEQKYLELVHRLDRDTSGLIMLAKKRSIRVWVR